MLISSREVWSYLASVPAEDLEIVHSDDGSIVLRGRLIDSLATRERPE